LLKETARAFDGDPRPPHYESDVQRTASRRPLSGHTDI